MLLQSFVRTAGSIKLSTDSDQKVTGFSDFEGYVLPDVNDLYRPLTEEEYLARIDFAIKHGEQG